MHKTNCIDFLGACESGLMTCLTNKGLGLFFNSAQLVIELQLFFIFGKIPNLIETLY